MFVPLNTMSVNREMVGFIEINPSGDLHECLYSVLTTVFSFDYYHVSGAFKVSLIN